MSIRKMSLDYHRNIDEKIIFSNKSLKESAHKQYAGKTDTTDFVKM